MGPGRDTCWECVDPGMRDLMGTVMRNLLGMGRWRRGQGTCWGWGDGNRDEVPAGARVMGTGMRKPTSLTREDTAAVWDISRGAGRAEGRGAGSCRLNAGASLPRADERPPVQTALDALRRLIPDRSRSEAQLQTPLRESGMLWGLCSEQPPLPGEP